tara:strand:+ start:6137 stop:7324 length:1188 start_codon:yes stop_codon:yes gene_type:complete
MIRTIYAVNFANIMFLTPLLYILNHPNIFNIGFNEEILIPFFGISFIIFKNVTRFIGAIALFNDYIFGKNYHILLANYIICYISILTIECYQICYSNNINILLFSIIFIIRQYLYSSIDYSLDQLDISYNQSYRVIGLLPLIIVIYGIFNKTHLITCLTIFYIISIFAFIHCLTLIYLKINIDKINNKSISIVYSQNTKNNKKISFNKFGWIIIMLLLVSYVDGSGDAVATEKLWNSKTTDYFLINSIVRIVASFLTFPPIQKYISSKDNIKNITTLIIFRFILLVFMKFTIYKNVIFFTQCSIDIYVGTIFMNDYLDKNKKIFWNSTTNSKYYISASFAYFINENVPPLIKMILVFIITEIGKKIEIGLYFTIPIMLLAITAINMINYIQKKIK